MGEVKEYRVGEGSVRIALQYIVAGSIDLVRAQTVLGAERDELPVDRRMPSGFGFDPSPLRLLRRVSKSLLKDIEAGDSVEMTIYHFGVIEVVFRVELRNKKVAELPALSQRLYQNLDLGTLGAELAGQVAKQLHNCLDEPCDTFSSDDTTIWNLQALVSGAEKADEKSDAKDEAGKTAAKPEELLAALRELLAQTILGEIAELTEECIAEVVGPRQQSRYFTDGLTIRHFNGLLIIGREYPGLSDIAMLSNAMLLELSGIDEDLDPLVERAAQLGTRPSRQLVDEMHTAHVGMIARATRPQTAINLSGNWFLQKFAEAFANDIGLPKLIGTINEKLNGLNNSVSFHHAKSGIRVDWIIVWLILLSIGISIFGIVIGAGVH